MLCFKAAKNQRGLYCVEYSSMVPCYLMQNYAKPFCIIWFFKNKLLVHYWIGLKFSFNFYADVMPYCNRSVITKQPRKTHNTCILYRFYLNLDLFILCLYIVYYIFFFSGSTSYTTDDNVWTVLSANDMWSIKTFSFMLQVP